MAGIRINNINKQQSSARKSSQAAPAWKSLLEKDILVFSQQLSDKKKYNFYNDLHILLSSGVDLKTALELLGANYKKKNDLKIIEKIRDDVIQGNNFSTAVQTIGKFTAYEYYSLKIGEETGRMQEIIGELASYYNNKISQKRKLINAFSYPLLVLVTAIATVIFMINVIIPMFADVFKKFNQELPSITRMVLSLSDTVSANMGTFVLIIIAIATTLFLFRKNEIVRKTATSIVLVLPVFGEMVRKIQMARFCNSMELMVSAKIPLTNAMELLNKMIRFYPLNTSLEKMEAAIFNGNSLNESMQFYKIYDNRMVSLIKVAEETNRLDFAFKTLKGQYNNEVEFLTTMLGNMLEPALIIFIGLFVGVILISMYLPMFQLGNMLGV